MTTVMVSEHTEDLCCGWILASVECVRALRVNKRKHGGTSGLRMDSIVLCALMMRIVMITYPVIVSTICFLPLHYDLYADHFFVRGGASHHIASWLSMARSAPSLRHTACIQCIMNCVSFPCRILLQVYDRQQLLGPHPC